MFLPHGHLENVLAVLPLPVCFRTAGITCNTLPLPSSQAHTLTKNSFKDFIKIKSPWNGSLFKMSDTVHGHLLFVFPSSGDSIKMSVKEYTLKSKESGKGFLVCDRFWCLWDPHLSWKPASQSPLHGRKTQPWGWPWLSSKQTTQLPRKVNLVLPFQAHTTQHPHREKPVAGEDRLRCEKQRTNPGSNRNDSGTKRIF